MLRARFISTLTLVLSAMTLQAQREPHIAYVYPAGGQVGTKFEIVVGGQFLFGPTNLYVSGPGIEAKVIDYSRPLTPKEINELREQARKLQERKTAAGRKVRRDSKSNDQESSTNSVWTAADEKLLMELRRKLMNGGRPPNPEIAEPVTIEVTIAPDAEHGRRELRLKSAAGLSNPLAFYVGLHPEFTAEAGSPDTRTRYGRNASAQPAITAEEKEMRIELPCVVNGQIMPGGVDRFRFSARKGQRLVLAAQARELIPYLANAVPGWFQATLALLDASGRELAFQDDFAFNPDPAFFYEIPKDGEYIAVIRDSIYRGRDDFVYRLSIGEFPYVTSIFPLGSRASGAAIIELSGWNLQTNSIRLEVKERGTQELPIGFMNRFAFVADTLPEHLEDQAATRQEVSLPAIINGRIETPGDRDVFQFRGTKGSTVVAEVQARRLNSPLDSLLKLTNEAGEQIAVNDDHEDKGAGLTSHHADSYIRAVLPNDGVYLLHLSDTQHKGGPEHAYRLRISSPQPDFDLRVVPSTINVRAGSSAAVTVYALRKDGFTGEIEVSLKNAPQGFALSGGLIPANSDKVRLTLAAPAKAKAHPVRIELEGHASIEGVAVKRRAVPAEDMMQAFAYRHLVPAEELQVLVTGQPITSRSPVKVLQPGPVKIPAGGTAQVDLRAPARAGSGRIQLELSEAPEGVTLQSFAANGEDAKLVFQAGENVKPDLKGNLIIYIFALRTAETSTNKQAPARRALIGTLPAIPFEIVQ